MHTRKAVIAGVALLVSLTLLLASAVGADPSGPSAPAAVYYWGCNANDECGSFYNSNTGSYADGLWGRTRGDWGVFGASYGSTGEGVYAYASGSSGTGVYGYSANYMGVRGVGGSGSGDYGGYFSGFEGVRGYATGSNGYGTWGTATGTYGRGAYGYASGTSGYGVYGYSYRYIGVRGYGPKYGGYFTGCIGVYGYSNCASGRGVYGYAAASRGEGVRGITVGYAGDGVTALATSSYGYGVDAQATGYRGYGGRFLSNNYRGLYADGASGWFDGYFPDAIYVGGNVYSSEGMSFMALNAGNVALEPGDLVAFSGFDASAKGVSGARLAVTKVDGANSGAVVGVVLSAYVQEAPGQMQAQLTVAEAAPAAAAVDPKKEDVPLPEVETKEEAGQEPPPPSPQPEEAIGVEPEVVPEVAAASLAQAESLADVEVGHFVEGAAKPGQYVTVLVQGIARVKVDASAGLVQAGDMLTPSASGRAINAAPASQAMIIGRALESLDKGTGMIYVFVSVR